MKYNRVALVLLCLVILGTPYYLNAAVCSSSCEASGKIINIISGNEYEIEYIENADIPINPKVEAAKLADIEIIYPLKGHNLLFQ